MEYIIKFENFATEVVDFVHTLNFDDVLKRVRGTSYSLVDIEARRVVKTSRVGSTNHDLDITEADWQEAVPLSRDEEVRFYQVQGE